MLKETGEDTKMKENLEIALRRMREADIPEIMTLGKSVSGFAVSEESCFWEEENLKSWLKNSKDPLLIAEDKGKIIGFIFAAIHSTGSNATIENIFIKEEYRHKGVGRQLLERCLEELKAQNVKYVCFLSRTNNRPAIEFALKHGFKQGYEFVWLEKILDKK